MFKIFLMYILNYCYSLFSCNNSKKIKNGESSSYNFVSLNDDHHSIKTDDSPLSSILKTNTTLDKGTVIEKHLLRVVRTEIAIFSLLIIKPWRTMTTTVCFSISSLVMISPGTFCQQKKRLLTENNRSKIAVIVVVCMCLYKNNHRCI